MSQRIPSRRCEVPGCRAWAMRGTSRCRSHTPHLMEGRGTARRAPAAEPILPYADLFTAAELDALAKATADESVDAEIALLRLAIRRVIERYGEDDPARALELLRRGVDSLVRAIRARRDLTGKPDDGLTERLGAALDELASEWGVSL
ncbi:MAG: hypothetical protein H5T64_11495 [Chloroflexi bacterium]|nr:hypothetical protein [Chloroflexota bacterium]